MGGDSHKRWGQTYKVGTDIKDGDRYKRWGQTLYEPSKQVLKLNWLVGSGWSVGSYRKQEFNSS